MRNEDDIMVMRRRTPFFLRNLENESVYDVRVEAINRLGSSNYSKVFNFYVKTTRKCNLTTASKPSKSFELTRSFFQLL